MNIIITEFHFDTVNLIINYEIPKYSYRVSYSELRG